MLKVHSTIEGFEEFEPNVLNTLFLCGAASENSKFYKPRNMPDNHWFHQTVNFAVFESQLPKEA